MSPKDKKLDELQKIAKSITVDTIKAIRSVRGKKCIKVFVKTIQDNSPKELVH
jgi:ribosomal protein S7